MASLDQDQIDVLLRPIKASRVSRNPQGMSYLETYDVIAHLTRVFGFEGWDFYVTSGPDMIFEEHGDGRSGKTVWSAAYKASGRLTIRNRMGHVVMIREDSATGDASNQPGRAAAHDLAIKSAVSTALKRAARTAGDQFGLSLYDKGSMDAVVKKLVSGEQATPEPPDDPHALEPPDEPPMFDPEPYEEPIEDPYESPGAAYPTYQQARDKLRGSRSG